LEVIPTAITGDMYNINKDNLAILHWFGMRYRFTTQLGNGCFRDITSDVDNALDFFLSGYVA